MQYASVVLNYDELIPYLLERMGIKKKFIRTSDEIQALQTQKAQAQQEAQIQAMQDDVAVANAKEEGKANAKLMEQ